ncbi:DUF2325 domain-containing protein [Clostridium sp. CX1]|uniref:DUF2325 domain-containing protein n=1 Tax=Clostridium tanneri TaxID=3037988 RepID=A0ABU4JY76_9CLOT|nr:MULTISPECIES: DUF2325 domain-containing protein [unclassified Clostridium]MCT8978809.1 DUF2325 domain-containing protein [Clostridium sp. CX1]MDW8803119.1 DUF2325 domain-containing protein [Clostridium sp. A1-XYC3]
MSILLVGADRLGNITDKLRESGFSSIEHISGRKSNDKKIKIPEKTDLILVLVDYVGHGLTEFIKRESKRTGIKIAFSKRSWTHMEKTIQGYIEQVSEVKKGRYN